MEIVWKKGSKVSNLKFTYIIQVRAAQKALEGKKLHHQFGGLVFDEVEIRSGLIYNRRLGLVFGLVSGPLREKDINTVKDTTIEKNIATKILQVRT